MSVDPELLLSRTADGVLLAARNRCRHQAGRFPPAGGPLLVCPRHGWCLDATTMRYRNPHGDLKHPTLEVVPRADGGVDVYEVRSSAPWEDGARTREPLEPGELTIAFLAHACAEIRCGDRTILTDPWLEGPAFTRGWWLSQPPPADWPDRLAAADLVYISHNHSDHLHLGTLTRLARDNPDVAVVVPDLPGRSCEAMVRATGLRNVVSAPPGTWLALGPDTRFTLLEDGAARHDTALLVDYRGHLVLDTVDCSDPNGGLLPPHVDVLLAPFAGGASGYPVCWPDQYSAQEIQRRLGVARSTLAQRSVDLAASTSADVFVPFAGSFTEAHPADAGVHAQNRKNRAADVAAQVRRHSPGTRTWVPVAGDTLDVATGLVTSGSAAAFPRDRSAEFDRFLPAISSSMDFAPLASLDGVETYMAWMGFTGDLVLHVVETDESFTEVLREFHMDFGRGTLRGGAPKRMGRSDRYLRMRVRADSFRHVLREGLPWEDLSIGFQARFYRTPDLYNFDFWDHTQNRLPPAGPWGPARDGA